MASAATAGSSDVSEATRHVVSVSYVIWNVVVPVAIVPGTRGSAKARASGSERQDGEGPAAGGRLRMGPKGQVVHFPQVIFEDDLVVSCVDLLVLAEALFPLVALSCKQVVKICPARRPDISLCICAKAGAYSCAKWLCNHGVVCAADNPGICAQALQYACAEGHFKTAQLIRNIGLFHREAVVPIFTHVCTCGNLSIARWLATEFQLGPDNIPSTSQRATLESVCQKGLKEIVQYLTDLFEVTGPEARSWSLLNSACSGGHLELASWLVDRFDLTADDAIFALEDCCKRNHFDMARWLADRFGLYDYDQRIKEALCGACKCGNLALAKWLVSTFALDMTDILSNRCLALQTAYSEGHIDIADWLLTEYPSAKEAFRDCVVSFCSFSIESVCRSGNLAHLKNIASAFSITAQDFKHCDARGNAIRSENVELIQWLAEEFSLAEDFLEAGSSVCATRNINFSKWFITHFEVPRENIINQCLTQCAVHGNCELAKWMLCTFSITPEEFREASGAISLFCSKGSLEFVQWMVETYSVKRDEILNEENSGFEAAFESRNFGVASWLIQHFSITRDDIQNDDIYAKCNDFEDAEWVHRSLFRGGAEEANGLFQIVSRNHDIDFGDWLVKNMVRRARPKHFHNVRALVAACEGDDVCLAKWFASTFELNARDIRASDAMELACAAGALHVAKWLRQAHGMAPPDVVRVFRLSCVSGNLSTAEWLHREFNVTADDVRSASYVAVTSACHNGHLDVAKWLVQCFSLTDLEMAAHSKTLLKNCSCEPRVVSWLKHFIH
ncbi:hypothetical protein Pelo_142 [Pelomyxa schiedti]|nr:hypothetical protein Pelo_142 [Pelomyxa schiedti]